MTNEQDYIKLGKAQDDISSVTNTIKDKKLLTVLTTHNGTEIKSTELELPTGDTVTKVSGSVSIDDKLTITVATDKGDKTTGPITLPVSKQYAKMKFSGEEATASALPLKKIVVGNDEWKIASEAGGGGGGKLYKHTVNFFVPPTGSSTPPTTYILNFISTTLTALNRNTVSTQLDNFTFVSGYKEIPSVEGNVVVDVAKNGQTTFGIVYNDYDSNTSKLTINMDTVDAEKFSADTVKEVK